MDNFNKEQILEMALESGKNRFRLLAAMNSIVWIFMWCDDEDTFRGMASHGMDEFNVDYTLEQLNKVVDNAIKWLNRVKNSDNPVRNVSDLYVMAI